jgi:RNA polymerase sigma-70 factor, ECF subfamily
LISQNTRAILPVLFCDGAEFNAKNFEQCFTVASLFQHDESQRRRFEAMFEAHGAGLVAWLRRLAGNPHDADEVFQETALRVWKNMPRAPRIFNPRAWLMTIGYRAFLDHQSRRPKWHPMEDRCDQRQKSPELRAEQHEAHERVNDLVNGLPPPMREVILLHYSGGLTLRQTAAAIGIPVGTAKSRLNQALQLLRSSFHEM